MKNTKKNTVNSLIISDKMPSKKEENKVLRATHGSPKKQLNLGERQIQCYVLEDGTAVLSGRGMLDAFGIGKTHGGKMDGFVASLERNSVIDRDLATGLNSPIRFVRPGRGGALAKGYEATTLTKLCRAISRARRAGKFENNQLMQIIADECEIIRDAFTDVGIIATIYEITGYEKDKATDAYQKYLEKFINATPAAWVKRFPIPFFELMCDLKGWKYQKGLPRYIPAMGHVINDVVYSRLAPGILEELKSINPIVENTRKRKNTHTSWLTIDVGIPALNEHLLGVMALAKANTSWRKFKDQMARVYPVHNDPKLYLFSPAEMEKMMEDEEQK